MRLATKRGHKHAVVALARKLAPIMHRIYGPAPLCKGIRDEVAYFERSMLQPWQWQARVEPAADTGLGLVGGMSLAH